MNSCPYGYYDNGYGRCVYSGWSSYGRWILLVAVLIFAFLIYLLFSYVFTKPSTEMTS